MSLITRRNFMAGTAALSLTALKPEAVFSTQANSRIKLGIIGCGGRGAWLAGLFDQHGGYEIAAAADYFEDRVNGLAEKFSIPASKCFTTLSCYQKLLETDVEAVAVESPPYFHPEQTAAAIDAGKHVYLAKPVAVDVPGCNSIAASGEKATAKSLCFLVDFQTRCNDFYIEAIKRIHDGAVGEFVFGEATYHCGRLGTQATPGTREARLRNWTFDKALSGDVITEQNVHTLDVVSWIMNQPPLHAFGTGGRKVRTDVGDCWDYFTLHIQYPNNVGITFSSRQFDDHGTAEGIKNRMFCTQGVLEAQYGGNVMIRARAEDFYRGGSTGTIYQDGAVRNIATFHDSIVNGRFDNPTVAPSVNSNLLTILGRTAAYENRVVPWEETVASETRLDGKLDGLKS